MAAAATRKRRAVKKPGALPPLERTLGPIAVRWIEKELCHGPGDVQGDRIELDDERVRFLMRAYEVDERGKRVIRRAMLSRPKGWAKALAVDTPIPTPDGWTVMGALAEGDLVFDERGRPVPVLAVSEIFFGHDCYEVVFSDGERVVADAGHKWAVEELRREYRTSIRTTEELFATQRTRSDGACNYRLQMPDPLRLDALLLPLDPYALGAWLGDGTTLHGDITSADREVVEQFELAGFATVARGGYAPYGYGIYGLKPILRDLGVLGNKHIPGVYLRASFEQRLALLQGLMDTDGTIGLDGRCGFTTTSKRLARDMSELLSTLGVKHATREFRTMLNGRDCGPGWKIDFHVYEDDMPVFRLSRKAERQGPRRSGRAPLSKTRRIVAVRPVESVPTRCITVDSDSHLFLAGRKMVQTHNSEFSGMVACFEALGPCRFGGWDSQGRPTGRPITSPIIPVCATEEGQAGDTYSAVEFMLREGPISRTPGLDVGLTRTFLPDGGWIRPVTSKSASKDGGRESFVVWDETHHYHSPELIRFHATIRRNLGKRAAAEPWGLEATTMYAPDEGSVAELSHRYAQKVEDGTLNDRTFLFDHLGGPDPETWDWDSDDELRAALTAAYGEAAAWMDMERLVLEARDPQTERSDFLRYFVNVAVKRENAWMPAGVWSARETKRKVEPGERIVLGFDGSDRRDATGLVGCTLDGHLFVVGCWERPERAPDDWRVPRDEVNITVERAMDTYNVAELVCDPWGWHSEIEEWAEQWPDLVLEFPMRPSKQAPAVSRFFEAAMEGSLSHDGDQRLARHVGNAIRRDLREGYFIDKPAKNSPHKIDLAVAAVLAYDRAMEADGGDIGVFVMDLREKRDDVQT